MPTATLEKIVDPDSGAGFDYSSLNAWEVAFGGVANDGDCVGQDTIAKAVCRCTAGTADATPTNINGWTATSATQYPWVYVDTSYRHTGVYATGNIYRFENNSSTQALKLTNNYCRLSGVLVKPLYDADYVAGIYVAGASTGCIIEDCVSVGSGTTGSNCYGYQTAADSGKLLYIRNCLSYDWSNSSRAFTCGTTAGTIYIYNCTAVDSYYGFRSTSANTVVLKNCVAYNCTDDYSGTYKTGTTNCAYSEGADPGASGIDISAEQGTALFYGYNSDDFHVLGTGKLYGAGANLYADAALTVTTDFEGDARPSSGAFDLGFDEHVGHDVTGGLAAGETTVAGVCTIASDAPGAIAVGAVALHGNVTTLDLDATSTLEVGSVTVSGDATHTAAANIVKKKIDPDNSSGTHYTSLFAWEAAYGGVSGSGDLVGTDQIAVAECYCTAGTADTTSCTIQGWTSTSASRYIRITVADGYRHKGMFPGSGNYYRMSVTGNYCLRVYGVDNVRVEYLAAKTTANANYQACCGERDAENVTWSNCVFTVTPGAYQYTRCFADFYCTAGTVYLRNCLAYGSTGTYGECYWIQARTGGTMVFHHCGAQGRCGINGTSNSGCTATCNNCWAYTSSTSFTGIPFINSTYNAYKVGVDPGTSGVDISGEAEGDLFITATTNYHIERTGTLYNAGTTLWGNATLPVQTDYHGYPRPMSGTVDLGPHEFVMVSGALTLPATTMAGVATNDRNASGDPTLAAVRVRGIVTMASTPNVWDAPGAITIAATTVDGAVGQQYAGTANLDTGLPTVRGLVTIVMPSPQFPTTLHGYEVFPISPEFAVVETQIYRVIQTEAEDPRTLTRAICNKVLRRWRLNWAEATEGESEILRGFVRDVRGPCLPFWFDTVDPIARPYDGPTLSSTVGGSAAARTLYVKYAWASGDLESLPSYESSTLAVNDSQLLVVTLPEFPQNVVTANIYVGVTAEVLHKQATPVTPTSLTWTEPTGGYDAAGAAPPTTNTLTERVLVHFGENALSITRKSAKRYEITVEFEELWIENPRVYYLTGALAVGATTVLGAATCDATYAAGTIDAPGVTVAGAAEITPSEDVFRATGWIDVGATTMFGEASSDIYGTYYVAKTGSDENPGTLAEPFLTIQAAVTTAGTGDIISVGPGTYAENIVIDAPMTLKGSGSPVISGTGTKGISATDISTVTIDGFVIAGQSYGVYETGGDSWTVQNCTIRDQTTAGIYLAGALSGTTYTSGNTHTVSGNAIYRIGNVDDACGIRLETCADATVTGNQLWLVHRDAIRDTAGESNEITLNWVQYCYVGVKVGVDTTDCYVHENQLDRCSSGIAFMGCDGRVNVNKAYKNTCYYCFTGCNIGYFYPGTDYCDVTYNIWKACGDRAVYHSSDNTGTHIVCDHNMYWSQGDRPTTLWVNATTSYATLTDVAAGTEFETNGVTYSCGTTGTYGCTGVTLTQPTFTPVAMTATSASHNFDLARRTGDFKAQTQWSSGVGNVTNEYIVYDFGSSKSWDYAILCTYGDNAEHTPQGMHIDSSPDGTTWTVQKTVTNTWGGGFKWYKLASTATSRYVRLYMTSKFSSDDLTWTANELKFAEFLVGNESGTGAISVSSLSTAWQRGKVYQLTAGAYGTLNFTTPESGTDYVEIRGASGVTVEKVSMASSYLKLVDLVISNTSAATSTPYLVDLVADVHHLYMDGCELKRPANTYLGRGVYATRGGNTDLTFVDCYFHDMWGPFYYGIGDTDVLFDGCTFKRNFSNSTTHSEGIDLNNTTRCTIKNCWLEDITGTAFIVALNQPCNYLYIYNNVFKQTKGSSYSVGHGTVSDNTEEAKSATSHYVYVYHNTFVTLADYSGRSGVRFWWGDNVFAYNNLFYACKGMAMLGITHDYTAAYDCPASGEYTPATHDETGVGNPFADTSYRLNTVNKHDGKVLPVLYEKDRDGNLRTHWHMGAYE